MSVQTAGISVGIPVSDRVAATASTRLGLLDLSRLIAAAGIVWVHVTATETGESLYPNLYPIGTFGVPFYLFIAILFMARTVTRDPSISLGKYILSRLTRVYIPFLAWTAVYCFLAELKYYAQERQFVAIPLSVLYAGGHMHLWFLSYLLFVSIIGAMLVRGLSKHRHIRHLVAAVFLLVGIACCFWSEPSWISHRPHEYGDQEFWQFAFRSLPTTFWALTLALVVAMDGKLPRTNLRLAVGGIVLWICAMLTMDFLDPNKFLRAMAGFGLVLFALWPVRVAILEKIGSLGKYSYGVYLSHVIFIRIFILWMQRYDYQPTPAFLMMEFAIVFACSLGLSILLSQSKYTRWLLGE